MDHVVYTYQASATPACHVYGPMSVADAEALASRLTTGTTVQAMVLPLEAAPKP